VGRHTKGANVRVNGRPRTKTRVTGRSCSTHSGPIVSVLHPGTVHFVTIGIRNDLPPLASLVTPSTQFRALHAYVRNVYESRHGSAVRVGAVRVLSLTHGPSVPGGVFEEEVVSAGHALERWVVPGGELPEPARSYDAVLVFGGSQHPDQDDRFAWLRHEDAFLQSVLAAERPVFGVCLGAQMLARAAGGFVGPARSPEIGWHEVSLTASGAADPVLGSLPARATVFQWHHYAFSLPPEGAALAESDAGLQAFRLDGRPAWGIQFHAEVTEAMLSDWIEEAPEELPMPLDELRAESETLLPESNAHGRALARAFLREAGR
jgi:GMP synthase (glutamine-hydrolysing)